MGVAEAVAAMGAGPLSEAALQRHVRPLFSRSLAGGGVYLANHTLGRMPDQTFDDVREGLEAWAERMRGAWEPWLAEEQRYRAGVGALLGVSAESVVPKPSAGAALRAVVGALPTGATVLTTTAEFASVAVVLRQWQALGRGRVERVAPRLQALRERLQAAPFIQLVVTSLVYYADGSVFEKMAALDDACRETGAELLVDAYHAVGALPVSAEKLGADYVIGGCYKYLRGGPGIAFVALGERVRSRQTPDAGWFALEPGADAWAGKLNAGGDGWMDGTPPVLPYYQARAGLELTQALGVERVRAYSLEQLTLMQEALDARGIKAAGGDTAHGAFLTVQVLNAEAVVRRLAGRGIVVDATGSRLRICPDVVTTRGELLQCAEALADAQRGPEQGSSWPE